IQDQFYARQQVLKFLRQLQPQDHVAIYVLTTKIIVLNEFTQDSTSLLQAIQKFGGYSSPQQDAANPAPQAATQSAFEPKTSTMEIDAMTSRLRDFLDAADGKVSDFANIDRAETTTSAIEAIANHGSVTEGCKSAGHCPGYGIGRHRHPDHTDKEIFGGGRYRRKSCLSVRAVAPGKKRE